MMKTSSPIFNLLTDQIQNENVSTKDREDDYEEISSDEIYLEITETQTHQLKSLLQIQTLKPTSPVEDKMSSAAYSTAKPTQELNTDEVDFAEDYSLPTESDLQKKGKFHFSWDVISANIHPIPPLPHGLADFLDGESNADLLFRPRSFRRYSHNKKETILPFHLEDALTVTDIYRLHKGFQRFADSGTTKVDRTTFCKLVSDVISRKYMTLDIILEFFSHIDIYHLGAISWFDVICYLKTKYSTLLENWEKFHGVVGFQLPALYLRLDFQIKSNCHIIGVVQISEDVVVLCSDNGVIVQWSLKDNVVLSVHKMPLSSGHIREPSVLDITFLQAEEKIFFSNDNYEIIVYDTKLFNFICKISGLASVPFKLDCCIWKEKEFLFLFGDEIGCVNAIIIPDLKSVLPTKRGVDDLFSQTLRLPNLVAHHKVKYIRWQVHSHSVNEIRYIPCLKAVASCCNDPSSALVIGSVEGFKRTGHFHIPLNVQSLSNINPMYAKTGIPHRSTADEYAFVVPRGVISFDCSEISHLIATGGTDKILRIWCPFLRNRPLEELQAHLKPVVLVKFHEKMQNFLLSVSKDRCICIWSSLTFRLLYSLQSSDYIVDFNEQLIHVYFSSISEKLFILSNSLYILTMKKQRISIKSSAGHSNTVTSVVIRSSNMTLLSACQNGDILEWDICTGILLGTFTHFCDEKTPITCLGIDHSQQYLLSAHDDGKISVWSLRNYRCLKLLQTGNFSRITTLLCKEVGSLQWIIAAGWDRFIHFFMNLEVADNEKQRPAFSIQDKSIKMQTGIIHRPFIQSMSSGPGAKLATSSDDGEIHIWNILTRTLIACLIARLPDDFSHETYAEADLQIRQIHFIQTRSMEPNYTGGCLLSLGPYDMMHIWCIYPVGRLLAQFSPTTVLRATGRCFVLGERDDILITGDTKGFVHVFFMKDFATGDVEESPPNLEAFWMAHEHSITCVQIVKGEDLLVTASTDFSIRLWTLAGEFFGVFGQLKTWDISLYNISELEEIHTEDYESGVAGVGKKKVSLTNDVDAIFASKISSPKTSEKNFGMEERISLKETEAIHTIEEERRPSPVVFTCKRSEQRTRKINTLKFVKEKKSSGTWNCLHFFDMDKTPTAKPILKVKGDVRKPLRKSTINSLQSAEDESWKIKRLPFSKLDFIQAL